MIALGSDHGGYDLKEVVKEHLQKRGFEVKDFGTYSKESCDYPDLEELQQKLWQAGNVKKELLSAQRE